MAQAGSRAGRNGIGTFDWHADYDQKENVLTFDFRIDAGDARRQPTTVTGNLDWAPTWCRRALLDQCAVEPRRSSSVASKFRLSVTPCA